MIKMARVCSKRKCHYLKIVQGQKIPNLSPHNTHRGAPRSTAEHRGASKLPWLVTEAPANVRVVPIRILVVILLEPTRLIEQISAVRPKRGVRGRRRRQ